MHFCKKDRYGRTGPGTSRELQIARGWQRPRLAQLARSFPGFSCTLCSMPPEASERRLAAILSADVVGYSRLMAEDEHATIRMLNSYRDLIASLVGDYHGRIVDATGRRSRFRVVRASVRRAVTNAGLQSVVRGSTYPLRSDPRFADLMSRVGLREN